MTLNSIPRQVVHSCLQFSLFCLIGLVFFFRGDIFDNMSLIPSVSFLIPLMLIVFTLLLILYVTILNKNFLIKVPPIYTALVCAFVFTSSIHLITQSETAEQTLRFTIEMMMNVILFYVVYVYLQKCDALKKLFGQIQLSSIPMIIAMLLLASTMDQVIRIGSDYNEDSALSIAVNHLGLSMSIVTIVCANNVLGTILGGSEKTTMSSKVVNLALLVLALGSTILTGSKAAILALLLYGMIIFARALKSNVMFVNIVVLAVIAVVVAYQVYSIQYGKYDDLATRFRMDEFALGVTQRMHSAQTALQDVGSGSFFLGEPWRYGVINERNPIHYPHNIILSMMLHTGIIPACLFLYLLITRTLSMAKLTLFRRDWLLSSTVLSILMATIIYSMTSGRLTRILTIIVALAITEHHLMKQKALMREQCALNAPV